MVLFIITFIFPWSRFLEIIRVVFFYIYCVQWDMSGVKRWGRFLLIPPSIRIASCISVGSRRAGQWTSIRPSPSSLPWSPPGCSPLTWFFSAEEGNAFTVAVMNLSWVMGTKLALLRGDMYWRGLRMNESCQKTCLNGGWVVLWSYNYHGINKIDWWPEGDSNSRPPA